MKIYVASKTKHAPMWLAFARRGVPISSSWIYEAGNRETLDWDDLWQRCIAEAHAADWIIVYRMPGEQLKGAFVEVGAAIAGGARVLLVGSFPQEEVGSWILHSQRVLRRVFDDVSGALEWLEVETEERRYDLPTTPVSERFTARTNARAADLFAVFCARPADFLDLVVAERTEVLDALRHRLSAGADQNSTLALKIVRSVLLERD